MKAIVLSLCIFCTSFISFSQTESELEKMPIVGIGLNLTQFRLSDMMTELYHAPANTLMVEVTPFKYARITPVIGFSSEKYKQELGPFAVEKEAKTKSLTYGFGTFGMYQYDKTNLYAGCRFEWAQIKNDSYEYNFDYVDGIGYVESITSVNREYTRNSIIPTIGAEYFFSRHFSFGAEFGVRFMKYGFTNNSQYGYYDEDTDSAIATDAGVQVRFYF